MDAKDADAVRRALAMLKNRGVDVTIDEAKFFGQVKNIMKPLRFLAAGVGTAYFYMFILEEAVQTAGFGVFTLMQGKLWREARAHNLRYRELLHSLRSQ